MPPLITISLREYERLIKACEALPALMVDNKRLHDQLSALRLLYSELLEKVGELERLL